MKQSEISVTLLGYEQHMVARIRRDAGQQSGSARKKTSLCLYEIKSIASVLCLNKKHCFTINENNAERSLLVRVVVLALLDSSCMKYAIRGK